MTKTEYAEYEKAVQEFFETDGIRDLSLVESESEPYFSWTPCDCCKRPEGGDRYDCSAYSKNQIIYEYSVCVDCYYYAEYGKLDDQTMLDLKEA